METAETLSDRLQDAGTAQHRPKSYQEQRKENAHSIERLLRAVSERWTPHERSQHDAAIFNSCSSLFFDTEALDKEYYNVTCDTRTDDARYYDFLVYMVGRYQSHKIIIRTQPHLFHDLLQQPAATAKSSRVENPANATLEDLPLHALIYDTSVEYRDDCTPYIIWCLLREQSMKAVAKTMLSLYNDCLRALCMDGTLLGQLADGRARWSLAVDASAHGLWCSILLKARVTFCMLQNIYDTLAVNMPALATCLARVAEKSLVGNLQVYFHAVDGYNLDINPQPGVENSASPMADALPKYVLHAYDVLSRMQTVLNVINAYVESGSSSTNSTPEWLATVFNDRVDELFSTRIVSRALQKLTKTVHNQLPQFERLLQLVPTGRCVHSSDGPCCPQCYVSDMCLLIDTHKQLLAALNWLQSAKNHIETNTSTIRNLSKESADVDILQEKLREESDWLLLMNITACFTVINTIIRTERTLYVDKKTMLSALANRDQIELYTLHYIRSGGSLPALLKKHQLNSTASMDERRQWLLEWFGTDVPKLLVDLRCTMSNWLEVVRWEMDHILDNPDPNVHQQLSRPVQPSRWSLWLRHLVPTPLACSMNLHTTATTTTNSTGSPQLGSSNSSVSREE